MSEPTTSEVAVVVTATNEIEAVVTALPSEYVLPYLRRLDEMTTIINKWKKMLEGRASLDGMIGTEYIDHDGTPYVFKDTVRGEFDDISALYADLAPLGFPAAQFAAATSGVRVTDLRTYAESIHSDPLRRDEMLRRIDDHRKYVHGKPSLQLRDSPYRKEKK